MSYLQLPTVRTFSVGGKQRHAVSFSYNFANDAVVPINIAGVSFSGSQFLLDISQLNFPATQQIPAFRSLQFANYFGVTNASDGIDGEIIISSPQTGQTIVLGSTLFDFVGTVTEATPVLSGAIPIVSVSPSQLLFSKRAIDIGGTLTLFGTIICSLFDFDLSSYITAGWISQDV